MYDLKRVDGMGKVDLALDVTQGLEDMHEHDVLHADIQAKQFLLDPVGGVNLNDFNRCEGVSCEDTVCAGAQRSPEEYEMQRIGTYYLFRVGLKISCFTLTRSNVKIALRIRIGNPYLLFRRLVTPCFHRQN